MKNEPYDRLLTVNTVCPVNDRLSKVDFRRGREGNIIDQQFSYGGTTRLNEAAGYDRGFDRLPQPGYRVVVTDDEYMLAMLAQANLQNMFPDIPFEFQEGEHGDDLYRLVTKSSFRPYLVLLDNDNSVKQGITGLLETRLEGDRTPAVVISGDIAKARHQAKECGLEGDPRLFYLLKPYTFAQFQAVVTDAINSHGGIGYDKAA